MPVNMSHAVLANICDDTFDTSRNRCFYVNCGVNF